MYSGTTLTPMKYFDAWFGAHQKIDRIARKHVATIFEGYGYYFPKTREILRFEGQNGPDGMKRKTPAQGEPWHFYNPHDPLDTKIVDIIEDHYQLLVVALREGNQTRAAFEASWLAHAIVDGLTPAHHYPYEQELVKLRGGEGIETRNSVKEKLLMHGDTISERLGNNWKMWGDKGLIATHFAFEWGIAVMISPFRFKLGLPIDSDLIELRQKGIAEMFKLRALQVADLNMYHKFYRSGWTPRLAKQVRKELIPLIVNTVDLAWYGAVLDSQKEHKARQPRKTA
jgi:hypothetical protein